MVDAKRLMEHSNLRRIQAIGLFVGKCRNFFDKD